MKKLETDKDLDKIVTDCKKMGYNVRVRDISFVYLCDVFADFKIAYKTLFNVNADNEEADTYYNSKLAVFLRDYIQKNYNSEVEEGKKRGRPKKEKDDDDMESITFEENRRAIEDDIRKLDKILIEGKDTLDIKEIASLTKLKIEARKTLNDKFGAGEKNEEQYIHVDSKYNHICEFCHHEMRIPTEEELISKYDLIKRK